MFNACIAIRASINGHRAHRLTKPGLAAHRPINTTRSFRFRRNAPALRLANLHGKPVGAGFLFLIGRALIWKFAIAPGRNAAEFRILSAKFMRLRRVSNARYAAVSAVTRRSAIARRRGCGRTGLSVDGARASWCRRVQRR